jgi:hypothetical protein
MPELGTGVGGVNPTAGRPACQAFMNAPQI